MVNDSAGPPTFQPVKSFPLNRLVNPGSTAGAPAWAAPASAISMSDMIFMMLGVSHPLSAPAFHPRPFAIRLAPSGKCMSDALKPKELDYLDHRRGRALIKGRLFNRGLAQPKLRVRDQCKSGISAQLRPVSKFTQAVACWLLDLTVFDLGKAGGFERCDGFPSRRELLADRPGAGPIAKQRWKPVHLVAE